MPVIFQIVGYHSSGKTTFLTQLITLLNDEGLRVVAIKHHGHGGKPEVVEDKDSTRYLLSGVAATIVEGDGRLLLQAERKLWTLEEKIQLLCFFEPDVILIEGFKKENYPKVLFIREERDVDLLTKLSNIKAVVFWDKKIANHVIGQANIPYFHISDDKAAKWVINCIYHQHMNKNS